MRQKISIILFIVFVTALFCSCAQQPVASQSQAASQTIENNETIVETRQGRVQGLRQDDILTFMGIPFAAPPVGELRFAPPQPAQPWDDVLDCTQFRDSALQASGEAGLSYSEDCLYLNIWTPEDAQGQQLPVLVFIHGGGYAQGSPALSMYDGTRFARDGIIQVNIAYRLNALGFLANEEIEAQYGYLGNAGVLDQIAALEWVQENISQFGGDPGNITISGESAGAFSVSNLILSPLAEGLFQRAIMESGNLLGQPIVAPTGPGDPAQARALSAEYAAFLEADSLADLQAMEAGPIAENAAFNADMTHPAPFNFWPVFDGKVIPENPYEALVQGQYHPVDILAGYNTDEGTLFIPEDTDEATYQQFVERLFGDKAPEVLAQYPVDDTHTPTQQARAIVKMGLCMGSEIFADVLCEAGQAVYYYNFDYSIPELDLVGLGTMHALELVFVFDTIPDTVPVTPEMEAFKEDVHNRWLNFIQSGDPNQGQPVTAPWEKYTAEGKEMLILNDNTQMGAVTDADEVAFFRRLLWGE